MRGPEDISAKALIIPAGCAGSGQKLQQQLLPPHPLTPVVPTREVPAGWGAG